MNIYALTQGGMAVDDGRSGLGRSRSPTECEDVVTCASDPDARKEVVRLGLFTIFGIMGVGSPELDEEAHSRDDFR